MSRQNRNVGCFVPDVWADNSRALSVPRIVLYPSVQEWSQDDTGGCGGTAASQYGETGNRIMVTWPNFSVQPTSPDVPALFLLTTFSQPRHQCNLHESETCELCNQFQLVNEDKGSLKLAERRMLTLQLLWTNIFIASLSVEVAILSCGRCDSTLLRGKNILCHRQQIENKDNIVSILSE